MTAHATLVVLRTDDGVALSNEFNESYIYLIGAGTIGVVVLQMEFE